MIAANAAGMMFPAQNIRWAIKWIGILARERIHRTMGIRSMARVMTAGRIRATIPATMTTGRTLTIRLSTMAVGISAMTVRVEGTTAAFELVGRVRRLQRAEDNDGLVVEVGGACLKVSDSLEDGVYGGSRGRLPLRFEELLEPVVAEHLFVSVNGVDDAVGEEDDEIAGLGGEGELFVFSVGEEAKREAFGVDCANGGSLRHIDRVGRDEERLHRAGVGDLE